MSLPIIMDSRAMGEAGRFRTTDWSMVVCAGGADAAAEEALNKLCQTYCYPLYAFIRRRGYDRDEAKDLTQDFFAHLVENRLFESADEQKGKFRSFLLVSLKNLLANDWDKKQAAKRGGKCKIVSLDDDTAENRYLIEPSHDVTPEKIYEQTWALTVLHAVVERLKKQYVAGGKGELFAAIQDYLSGDGAETYAAVAVKLQLTESAVKMAVLRMRRHFRLLLRAEVGRTVSKPAELEQELRHLFASLGG